MNNHKHSNQRQYRRNRARNNNRRKNGLVHDTGIVALLPITDEIEEIPVLEPHRHPFVSDSGLIDVSSVGVQTPPDVPKGILGDGLEVASDEEAETQEFRLLRDDVRYVANKTAKTVHTVVSSPYNLYTWIKSRSTKYRARKRAHTRYRGIVKEKVETDWDNDGYFDEDIVNDEPEVVQTGDDPCLLGDLPDPLGDRKGDFDSEEPNLETDTTSELSTSTKIAEGLPGPMRYTRGERAHELAAAIEVQFGKLSHSAANREVARRFASRHELVRNCSVRNTHQARLIARAIAIYFIVSEDDLVNVYTLDNSKQRKRIKQLGLSGK